MKFKNGAASGSLRGEKTDCKRESSSSSIINFYGTICQIPHDL